MCLGRLMPFTMKLNRQSPTNLQTAQLSPLLVRMHPLVGSDLARFGEAGSCAPAALGAPRPLPEGYCIPVQFLIRVEDSGVLVIPVKLEQIAGTMS
jgi:hypothetical protein